MKQVIKNYSQLAGIIPEKLCNAGRKSEYVDLRHTIWFLLRRKGYKTVEIAEYFHLKSHSTIIYGCTRVKNLLDVNDKRIKTLINLLNTNLYA